MIIPTGSLSGKCKISAVTTVVVDAVLPEWPLVLAKSSISSPTLVNFVVTKPSILITAPDDSSMSFGVKSSAITGCKLSVTIKKISKQAGFRMNLLKSPLYKKPL